MESTDWHSVAFHRRILKAGACILLCISLSACSIDDITDFISAIFGSDDDTVSQCVSPVVTGGLNFSVHENSDATTEVGTLNASHLDDSSRWTLVSSSLPDAFILDQATGLITVSDGTLIDFEQVESVEIVVNVGKTGCQSAEATVAIRITDIDECLSPVITGGLNFSVAENSDATTEVGKLNASHLDDSSRWTLVSSSLPDAFILDQATGLITVSDGTLIDFEQVESVEIVVNVGKTGCQSAEATVAIRITDVDETPKIVTFQQFFVSESAATGDPVGTVIARSYDSVGAGGASLENWSIVDGNSDNIFDIDSLSGQLSIRDNSQLDFESADSHSLSIQVEDRGFIAEPTNITIVVIDENDSPPEIRPNQVFSISEAVPAGTQIGIPIASDPEFPVVFFDLDEFLRSVLGQPLRVGPFDAGNPHAINAPVLVSGLYTGSDFHSNYNQWDIYTDSVRGDINVEFSVNYPEFVDWRIESGNFNDALDIDPITGAISVARESVLDAMANPALTLGITVSDGQNRSAITSVLISVEPVPSGISGIESNRSPKLGIEHVIHISIDGLHPSAITELGQGNLPTFYYLRQSGSFTDNARADGDLTWTLPNHTSQLTGRPVFGDGGHHWWINEDVDDFGVGLHQLKGSYLTSVFDVVHDYGLSTALYASKEKFSLFDAAWNEYTGAIDNVTPDSGRDKIDQFVVRANTNVLMDEFIADFSANKFNYSFLHLKDPDSAGHNSSWSLEPGSDYLEAVVRVDGVLSNLLAMIQNDARFNQSTVILITADHGGNFNSNEHNIDVVAGRLASGVVPLYIWGKGVPAGEDLYDWAPLVVADPGSTHPENNAIPPPIKNADVPNLALEFLGLPSIPDSTIDNLKLPF